MLIAHITVRVKPEFIEAFKKATAENARNSVAEAGIVRFDVLQQKDSPDRFVFIEAYRTPEAAELHKETEHYKTWRDTVAEMMAEPRSRVEYSNFFPEDAGW